MPVSPRRRGIGLGDDLLETQATPLVMLDQMLDAILEAEAALAMADEQPRARQGGYLLQAVDVGGERVTLAETQREAGVITNST